MLQFADLLLRYELTNSAENNINLVNNSLDVENPCFIAVQ